MNHNRHSSAQTGINRGQLVQELLNRNTIGFPDLFAKELARNQDFPKYAIYNSITPGDYSVAIEIALAGYHRDEFSVSWDAFSLHITSRSAPDSIINARPLAPNEGVEEEPLPDSNPRSYRYNGIARRHFQLRFLLAPYVENITAFFKNGILTVQIDFDNNISYLSKEVNVDDIPAASRLKIKVEEESKREAEKDQLRVLAGIKPLPDRNYGDGHASIARMFKQSVDLPVAEDRNVSGDLMAEQDHSAFYFDPSSDQPPPEPVKRPEPPTGTVRKESEHPPKSRKNGSRPEKSSGTA